MKTKKVDQELVSEEIPLWDNTGYILVYVKRELVFDLDATVPIGYHKPFPHEGMVLSCRYRLRIDKFKYVESKSPRFEDTLLEAGWVESDPIPILPWVSLVSAMEIYREVKNNTTHISNALQDLEKRFEELSP